MKPGKAALGSRIVGSFGIALVIIAYSGAIFNTFRIKQEEEWTEKKVIRICHWQLEAGFREALDYVIREFEKRHPDTRVIQLTMYNRAYPQFVTTQLIGGTAPDILQIGGSTFASGNDMPRFYYPLGDHLSKPNPYNAENDLRDVPWLLTFKHLCAYNWHAASLNYYSIGLTGISQRMTYNRNLMLEILGEEKPPRTYRELLAFCDTVLAYSKRTGKKIWPIASSRDQGSDLALRIANALGGSIDAELEYDRDLDMGHSGLGVEQFLSWMEGRTNLNDPIDSVRSALNREVSNLFEPGYLGKQREDALLSFIQQRAVLIATPSWDMNSLVVQARQAGFDIGVINWPRPTHDDPVYGKYVDLYKGDSRTDNNYPFGICRQSRRPEVAHNFLKFWSSKEIAEEFCKRAGLMCAIVGTENIDFMQPFEPDYRGLPPTEGKGYTGNQMRLLGGQIGWQYDAGTISYAEYISRLEQEFPETGMKDFLVHLELFRGNLIPANHALSNAALRLRTVTDPDQRSFYERLLQFRTDAAVRNWTNLQGNIHELLQISGQEGNSRTERVKKSAHYRIFLKTFPNGIDGTN